MCELDGAQMRKSSDPVGFKSIAEGVNRALAYQENERPSEECHLGVVRGLSLIHI